MNIEEKKTVDTISRIVKESVKLGELTFLEAKEDLESRLSAFDVQLISFERTPRMFSNIVMKAKKPFGLSHMHRGGHGYLVGEEFVFSNILMRAKTNTLYPKEQFAVGRDVKEWAEDLAYALDGWAFKYGSELQVMVGDKPYHPVDNRKMDEVKRFLKSLGWKGKLLFKAMLKVVSSPLLALIYLRAFRYPEFRKNTNHKKLIKKLMVPREVERLRRTASSQASWSLLSSGVSQARVDAHIIRLTVNQLLNSLEKSKLKEEIYKHVGDNLEAIPKHLSKLERSLDRTNYSLITLGSDWYRQKLIHEDRETVDLASKFNPMPIPANYRESGIQKDAGLKDVWVWFKSQFYSQGLGPDDLMSKLEEVKQKPIPATMINKKIEALKTSRMYVKVRDKIYRSAKKDLERVLKPYGYIVSSFEPSDTNKKLVRNSIVVEKTVGQTRKPQKFSDFYSFLTTKKEEQDLKLNPDPSYEDLMDQLDRWCLSHGRKLRVITGEVTPSKRQLSNMVAFYWDKATRGTVYYVFKKLRVLFEAIFEAIDASALGLVFTLYLGFSSGFVAEGVAVGLFVVWLLGFVIVGYHKAIPIYRRFRKL